MGHKSNDTFGTIFLCNEKLCLASHRVITEGLSCNFFPYHPNLNSMIQAGIDFFYGCTSSSSSENCVNFSHLNIFRLCAFMRYFYVTNMLVSIQWNWIGSKVLCEYRHLEAHFSVHFKDKYLLRYAIFHAKLSHNLMARHEKKNYRLISPSYLHRPSFRKAMMMIFLNRRNDIEQKLLFFWSFKLPSSSVSLFLFFFNTQHCFFLFHLPSSYFHIIFSPIRDWHNVKW